MTENSLKAHDLNRRLHDLCYELGLLALAARDADFSAAVSAVKAAQAALGQTDLVVDASRE